MKKLLFLITIIIFSTLIQGDSEPKVSFGEYSLKPHFDIKVTYNFNEYNNLIQQSKNIINDNKKTDLSYLYTREWTNLQTNSCNKYEKIIEILEEELTACFTSETNLCYCSLDLSQLPDGEYDLELENTGKNANFKITTDNGNIIEKQLQFPLAFSDSISSGPNSNLFDKKTILTIKNKRMALNLDLPIQSIWTYTDTLHYFKRGGRINFIKPELITNEITNNKCRYSKRYYRFCSKSQQKLLAHDFSTKETGFLNTNYKFALYFEDNEPPPLIENPQIVYDELSQKAIIEFDPSKSLDIKSYNIHCIEADQDNNPPDELTVTQTTQSDSYTPSIEEINDKISISTTKCRTLDQGFSNLQPGKTYFFAITPVDMFENENREINNYFPIVIPSITP